MDFLLQVPFVPFVPLVPLINSQQRMIFFPSVSGGGSLVVADGEQSISLAVCEASQGEKWSN